MAVSSVSSDMAATQVSDQKNLLGKDDFLKLLIVQLQNQDPLNPQDSLNSIAQLAEFTSLESMQNIQRLLEQQMALSESGFNAQMLGLIGKEVRAVNDLVKVDGTTKPRIAFDADKPGQAVVSLVNSAGRVVASEKVLTTAGVNYYSMENWNVPDGVYQVQVRPVLENGGENVLKSYTVYTVGLARAVDFSGSTPVVDLDGQLVYISAIVDVREAGYSFPVPGNNGNSGGGNNNGGNNGGDGGSDGGDSGNGGSSGGGSTAPTLSEARGSGGGLAIGDRSGRTGLTRGLFGTVEKALSLPRAVAGSVLDILN